MDQGLFIVFTEGTEIICLRLEVVIVGSESWVVFSAKLVGLLGEGYQGPGPYCH